MIEERDVQAALDANVDAGLMERTADGYYRLTRKGEHHVCLLYTSPSPRD